MASPSLEVPGIAALMGAVVSGCADASPRPIPASIMTSICLFLSWCTVYGHAHAGAIGPPSRNVLIAMVSLALSRCCSRQSAAALQAASLRDKLHRHRGGAQRGMSSYVTSRLPW